MKSFINIRRRQVSYGNIIHRHQSSAELFLLLNIK